ncbi:MAG TPA: hypothetical protein O0W91_03225 [Methanocorpusculum sp.]|nr:hypothetical protein [Methanocorpusculum sp.]
MSTLPDVSDNWRGIRLIDIMRADTTMLPVGSTTVEAARLMCRDDVGSCIITENGCPKGIVTEKDFICKVMSKIFFQE